MTGQTMDPASASELETLMREFPDWQKHHPEIVAELNPPRYTKMNRKSRQDNNEIYTKKRCASFPNSHYSTTFTHHQQRPRSTKQPAPTPSNPYPPPMSFVTNQRTDFVEKDLNARGKLIKKEEKYVAPEVAVEGTTNYMQDYPGHAVLPRIVTKPMGSGQIKRPGGKMDLTTSTMEHYKHWAPDPTIAFGELPTFTGSILYPNQSRVMQTTTATTFKGEKAERRPPIPQSGGNIKIEGAHDMKSTSQSTYTKKEGAPPPLKVQHPSDLIIGRRSKFQPETQSMRDYGNFAPTGPPQSLIQPPPSTIQLQFDDRLTFETEQRKEYQGIDIRQHPMAKSCKAENEEYQRPGVKFETDTNQKLDYQPIDIVESYLPLAKGPTERREKVKGKMDLRTSNRQCYKKWDVPAPVRYGDFHESHTYIPPMGKFEGNATTATTFLGQPAPISPRILPKAQIQSGEGGFDFSTMYNASFKQPNPLQTLNKAQAKLLLNELRHRKAELTAQSMRTV